MTADELRAVIVASLHAQGFQITSSGISSTNKHGKETFRNLHATAVEHRRERARLGLQRHEPHLLERIAEGSEVEPSRIRPRLVRVEPKSRDELFFRYASLHWSIPTSAGYGRRLRFLVIDDTNDKVLGLFALGDPIIALNPRDKWIGWEKAQRHENLRHVMDAFVLGAVPPYSFLLGSKLVAMLVTSREVREAFREKYSTATSRIKSRNGSGELALVTTTSALGRSSVYNRLRYGNRKLFESVGFTQGSGDFHFANGTYATIRRYALEHCRPTAKDVAWGTGFRNRREVIRKVLPTLGLSRELVYHGIPREIFMVPLARNTREFLRGEESVLDYYDLSVEELFEKFRERWLLSRAERDRRFQDWTRESWRLWSEAKREDPERFKESGHLVNPCP